MKSTSGIITCFFLFLFSNCTSDQLEEKEETIELMNMGWACECAEWNKTSEIEKYKENLDSLADLSVFIEADENSVELPDSLGSNGNIIKFTGRFYKEKKLPLGYTFSYENPKKAKVFRYTKYTVLKHLN